MLHKYISLSILCTIRMQSSGGRAGIVLSTFAVSSTVAPMALRPVISGGLLILRPGCHAPLPAFRPHGFAPRRFRRFAKISSRAAIATQGAECPPVFPERPLWDPTTRIAHGQFLRALFPEKALGPMALRPAVSSGLPKMARVSSSIIRGPHQCCFTVPPPGCMGHGTEVSGGVPAALCFFIWPLPFSGAGPLPRSGIVCNVYIHDIIHLGE